MRALRISRAEILRRISKPNNMPLPEPAISSMRTIAAFLLASVCNKIFLYSSLWSAERRDQLQRITWIVDIGFPHSFEFKTAPNPDPEKTSR